MFETPFEDDVSSVADSPKTQAERNRNYRRAAVQRAIAKQSKIATARNIPLTPKHKKTKALSCRSNCGLCRNPRFNSNSSGTAKLTMAERRHLEDAKLSLETISAEDFELLPESQAA